MSELLFPSICVFCDRKIHDNYPMEAICRSCLAKIPFRIGNMNRIKCLEEKESDNKGKNGKWNIDVITACNYSDMIRKALISMKFYDAAYMKHAFGNIINYVISQQKESFDGIIPIPLHISRKIERGYNQAELIACKISELSHIPLLNDCLVRSRKTKRQSEMRHYQDRLQNVTDAFCCIKPDKITGKKILLLDDILTSGETMICAAHAIKKAVDDLENTNGIGLCDYRITGLVLASNRK